MTSDCHRGCVTELLAQRAVFLAHEPVWQRPSDLDEGARERDGGGLGLPLDHGQRTCGQGTVLGGGHSTPALPGREAASYPVDTQVPNTLSPPFPPML